MNGKNWTLILRTVILSNFPQKTFVGNSIYGIYEQFGVRLINRMRLGFSYLREHKFGHNFANTANPLCSCILKTENTEHFFLRCQNNLSACTTLMNELNNVSYVINSLNSTDFIN